MAETWTRPATRRGDRPRRPVVLATILLVIGAAAVAGWWTWRVRRLRAELAAAASEMDAGRHTAARARLTALRRAWPRRPEVLYRLGQAEQATGRPDRALEAWQRVGDGNAWSPRAAAGAAMIWINQGEYSRAEAVLLPVLDQTGPGAYEVLRALARLYRFEGRTDDVRHLIERMWPLTPDRAELLKESWSMDGSPLPVDPLKVALDHADAEDDRVWLGQANRALRVGDLEAARRWLDRCEARRPSQPPVLRAYLDLAVAANDPQAVMAAAARLAADQFPPAAIQRLRAWLAARRGQTDLEQRELERLLDLAPGDTAALERLAELATRAGRAEQAAALRRRKAEIDQARDAYRKLIQPHDAAELVPHAARLADLAALQHRDFEARGWSAIARGEPPNTDTAPPARPVSGATASLADRLADLAPPATAPPGPPATAFIPTPPDFHDDAERVGLRFAFDAGHSSLAQLPEIMSGGLAILDYDGDGWMDVYCPQGGPCHPRPPHESDRLFHNRGDGTFEDATESAGIDRLPRGYGHGAAVGDYDNDGDPDLFLTRLGSYALLRNRGDGTFEDATEPAGLSGTYQWPSSAAFADLDDDGDLDLYVCHYARWDPGDPRLCLNQEKQTYFYCDPSVVEAGTDHLFRNDDGHFTDMTAEAGITTADTDGRGLGVVAADLDGDHRIDLYVANDGTANFLFRNLGGFRFEEVGHAAGVAGNAQGGYQAGMGVAGGDLDGDGRPDLVVTNFYGEGATFYHNLGGGLFVDRSAESGLLRATKFLLGFGAILIDYDRDGRRDLMMAHGNVNDNRPFFPFAMPTRLLAGDGLGRLVDTTDTAGPPWDLPHLGRALASCDLDNNGTIDALLVPQNEPLVYFHNRTEGGRSLTLRLEGTRSNRDAVGAEVTVTAAGRRQVVQRQGGGSYLCASDPRLHFGLGTADRVEALEVRWPSGRVDRAENLESNRSYHWREGDPAPVALESR